MDRRMYRGNMGNNCASNKNISPYRSNDPISSDGACGYTSDELYCKDTSDFDRGCDPGCGRDHFPIGMCYVPWQCFRELYENEFTALCNGTIFKELNLGWYGRSCK